MRWLTASRRRPGAATDGALMTALYSDPSFLGDLRADFAGGGTLTPSRDGRALWSAPDINGEPVVRWDVATGRNQRFSIPDQGDLAVHNFALVSDTTAAVVLDDENGDTPEASPVRLIDLAAGKELTRFDFGPGDRAGLAELGALDADALVAALTAADLDAKHVEDGAFIVDANAEAVGRAALEGGVVLVHLAPSEGAGLEQLFFELTESPA